MKRGDLVTVSLQGDYGKPRPAVVLQANLFADHPSVTVLPVTSELRATPLFRVTLEAGGKTGLRKASQVMVDKAVTLPRDKIGPTFGQIDAKAMAEIDRCVAVFFGIAK